MHKTLASRAYSVTYGVVLGVGMVCKHGAELLSGISVKDAANGQCVRGCYDKDKFPHDFGKILR